MFTKHIHTHPRESILWREGPGEGGDGKKGIQESKEQEKEKAKKWGLEVTSRIFPNVLPPGKTPEILLKEEIVKLSGIDTSKEPYRTIIAEIRMFMKGIFDENTKQYKTEASKEIIKLRYALSDGKESNKRTIDNLAKDAEEFKKNYPIQVFTQKVFDDAVKHPFISKTWVIFNEYKNLKKQVASFGNLIGAEYGAVIKTAENIMESKEFGKNTGKIDELRKTLEGKKEESDTFQRNMQTCLEQAGIEKRVFSFDDFNDRFNENRLLNETEKKFISDYISGVEKDIQTLSSKDAKIQRLQAFIENNKRSPTLKASQKRSIIRELQSLQSKVQQGTDGGIIENLTDKVTGRGDDREKAYREAKERGLSTGKRHLVGFTAGKYYVISIEAFRDVMEKDVSKNVNIGAFSGLLGINEWKDIFMQEFGEKAISSVGAYIQQNPNTRLFAGENAKAKDFFIQEYKKTVDYQQRLLNEQSDKLYGNFNDLFPSLKNHPKITPEIQELIKGGKIAEAYNKLAVSGATNGDIKQIMDSIEKDAKSLKEKGLIEISKQEIQFKGKRWSEFKNDFDLKNEDDRKEFEKLASMQILSLNPEKRAFLLRIVRKDSEIGKYIMKISDTRNAGSIQAQANVSKKIASSKSEKVKATPLTEAGSKIVNQSGTVGGTMTDSQIINQQINTYVEGMSELKTVEMRQNKLAELESRSQKGGLSQKESDLLNALKIWSETRAREAISVENLKQSTSREEAARLIRETSGVNLSVTESLRYVDSQTYIAKYVAEKNFVDTIERNAAKMNTRETKTLSELYNEKGQVDVSRMTESTGSISLSETNLMTHNTFRGMSELMQCQVRMGSDGDYLHRTILNREGEPIIKNIHVDNLDATIQQLGRFYAIGLGILAPYMLDINTAIKNGRTASVKGTDGTFDIGEDKKFLEIMARLLYNEKDIPEEKNIPNLIRVFQSVDPEKSPLRKLKKAGIIDESKQVNTTILEKEVIKASKEVK